MLMLLSLLGCAGNIHELYEATRQDVLSAVPAAGNNWQPDVRARIDPAQLNDVAGAALDAGLLAWKKKRTVDGPLGITASFTPSATAERLNVVPGKNCDDCLSVTGNLSGKARWEVGSASGTLPFTARIAATVSLALEQTSDGFQLRGKVTDIKRVKLSGENRALRVDLDDALGKWARKGLAAAPVFTVADLGGDKLPLRAARLRIGEDAIAVDALSSVEGGPVSASTAEIPSGADWEVRVSEETVAAMMRRAAFEAGTVDFDVAIDPVSIDAEGGRFVLGLRLWRLAGRGWWRDYRVQGDLGVEKRKLTLSATGAEEVDKSKGAGLADPIALLAERRILEAITDNLQQAVPGAKRTSASGLTVKAVSTAFVGEGDALVLRGTLQSSAAGD